MFGLGAQVWQSLLGLQTVSNIWMLSSRKWWAPLYCLCTEIHWTIYVICTEQYGFFFFMQIPLLISWVRMFCQWRKYDRIINKAINKE